MLAPWPAAGQAFWQSESVAHVAAHVPPPPEAPLDEVLAPPLEDPAPLLPLAYPPLSSPVLLLLPLPFAVASGEFELGPVGPKPLDVDVLEVPQAPTIAARADRQTPAESERTTRIELAPGRERRLTVPPASCEPCAMRSSAPNLAGRLVWMASLRTSLRSKWAH